MKKRIYLFIISVVLGTLLPSLLMAQNKESAERDEVKPIKERVRVPDRNTYVITSGDSDAPFYYSFQSQASSKMSLSKTFNGETKSNEGTFDVDDNTRNLSFNISGSVKSGKIVIKMYLPGGDLYKEVTLDSSADMQMSSQMNISKDEKKYYGKWKYSIEAEKAEGSYRFSILTN